MAALHKDALSDEQFDQLLRFFQVFSNESRLKIIGHLANGEASVGELAQLLDLKEPTISHHLAELKGLNLVSVRAEGTMRIYQLNVRALEAMSKDIFARPNLAALVKPSDLTEEERVLRNWVDGDRLKEIPAQEKKKLIVLRWLAAKIDPERRYTEREISDLLATYNEDYAVLRRYLVDCGFMTREKGIYWRTPENEPEIR